MVRSERQQRQAEWFLKQDEARHTARDRAATRRSEDSQLKEKGLKAQLEHQLWLEDWSKEQLEAMTQQLADMRALLARAASERDAAYGDAEAAAEEAAAHMEEVSELRRQNERLRAESAELLEERVRARAAVDETWALELQAGGEQTA